MAERLSTGIDVLDRELNGGLPAGSVVAYHAPPASQGELLLYELTRPRPTLYLSTNRTEEVVADAFENTLAPTGDPDVAYISGDDPVDRARRAFRTAGEETTIIVDPVDALERCERTRYESFLNQLQNHLKNTGGVAILHCLEGEHTPELRATTNHMADAVLKLSVDVGPTEINTRLSVPKLRGGRAVDETIKLNLLERVQVDTSRDIA